MATILLISCNKNQEIDPNVISDIEVYKDAKNVIFENIVGINKTLANKENHLAMRSWNLYYFKNSILPENPNLESLELLWENNYISNNKVNGRILVGEDKFVGFTTFVDEGFFNSITHILVYSEKEYKYLNSNDIITSKTLDKDWTYYVLNKYTTD